MIKFEEVLAKVKQFHPNDDLEVLKKAYRFSADQHKGQHRESGEPFLNHPVAVANILADMRLDSSCVSVGLLHDVVEDTLVPLKKIEQHFGKDISNVINGLTKIRKFHINSKEAKQAENFRRMFLAMVDDIRVVLVKLADRLHNMRTLKFLPPERRKRIAQETLDIYAPIAHRLGMGKIRGELEDIAFITLNPETYFQIEKEVKEKRKVRKKLLNDTKEKLIKKCKQHKISCSVESRIKRTYSIYQKVKKQKIPVEQVYDLLAIRIITASVDDCYLVLGIIHNLWQPVPGRIKDYIALPRPNMYQSIHTSVIEKRGQPFEVQIRTNEMHRVAEEGIAAHWKYKLGQKTDKNDDQRFLWLRHLVEWHQEVNDPSDFLRALKVDLYPEEVYTFSPKGKVVALPRQATPVDFAYAIHSEVGDSCVGAKVNGRIVSLKSQLKNGDIVEIHTQKGHFPNRDWLSFVKTYRARNRIKHYLNVNQKKKAIELGRRILEKEARRYKINIKKHIEDGSLLNVAQEYHCAKMEDLYVALGFGRVFGRTLLSKFLSPEELKDRFSKKTSFLTSTVNKVLRRPLQETLKVKNIDDILVSRAKCCNPIKGEEIVGYLTRGKGVAVHATRCTNVGNLLYNADRKVDVLWTRINKGLYGVKLSISVDDRRGMLAEITSQISEIKTNIKDIEAQSFEDNRGLINVTIEVNDIKHLEKTIKSIEMIENVNEIVWQ